MLRVPHVRIVAPVEHRVDHDRVADGQIAKDCAERRNLSGAVASQRYRNVNVRIEALRDKDVAMVEGRRLDANQHLVLANHRHRNFLDVKILRAADRQ